MFGKIMSIPDDLMWTYYELITDRTPQTNHALKHEVSSGALHPMDAKMRLGEEIVSGFHGPDPAAKPTENFQRVFRDRHLPPTCLSKNSRRPAEKINHSPGRIKTRTVKSEAEASSNKVGVELNQSRIDDPRADLDLTKPAPIPPPRRQKRNSSASSSNNFFECGGEASAFTHSTNNHFTVCH